MVRRGPGAGQTLHRRPAFAMMRAVEHPVKRLLLVLATLHCACSAPRQVVVVTIDTLRADHVGVRQGVSLTPALDRLAGDAVVYKDAIANASLTLPSHASFFSGRYPWRHRVLSNKMRLADDVPWLPVVLREHGFTTAAVVSSVAVRGAPSGFGRGFSSYDDAFDGHELNRKKQLFKSPGRATSTALEWLHAHRDESFFLWVHYLPPHGPYKPPAEFLEGLNHGPEGPALLVSASNLERGAIPAYQPLGQERNPAAYRRAYAAHVRYADHHVGRLLQTLRDLGIYERALVVVTSDHGESLGERGFYFCHGNLAYQEQVAIPLLVKRPDNRDAGLVVDEPVEGVDLAPSVLQELGLAGAIETDGRSILPEALAKTSLRLRYTQAQNQWQVAAYSGPLKLVLPLVPRRPSETEPASRALFDLRHDPAESHDLSNEARGMADRLEAALRKRHADSNVAGDSEDRERDEHLRALGYVN